MSLLIRHAPFKIIDVEDPLLDSLNPPHFRSSCIVYTFSRREAIPCFGNESCVLA